MRAAHGESVLMIRVIIDVVLFSCMAAFVTGFVIIATNFVM